MFNGAGTFDAEKMFENWASPLEIESETIALKQFPCCGSTHPAVDALLALRRDHDFAPERIRRIDSWTHPRRLAHTDRPDPQTHIVDRCRRANAHLAPRRNHALPTRWAETLEKQKFHRVVI